MYQESIKKYLIKNQLHEIDLQAVLFDMDGVLFDSMPIHARAWSKTLHEFGLNFTEEESYLHEGRTGSGTINIVFNREKGRDATPDEIKRIYDRKTALFDASHESPVMPGALELLEQIKANDLQRILVTGSGQNALISKMNHFFPGYFTPEGMVTAYDVKKGKPDAEPYLKGLRKAGVRACNAVVVENAPLGIIAAKTAGIFTIAVNTGKLADHFLTDAGADLLFKGMLALSKAWNELFSQINNTKVEI